MEETNPELPQISNSGSNDDGNELPENDTAEENDKLKRRNKWLVGRSEHWESLQMGIADSQLFKSNKSLRSNNSENDSSGSLQFRWPSFGQNKNEVDQLSKSTMDSSSNDEKPPSIGINDENQDDEMLEIEADLKLLGDLKCSNYDDDDNLTEKHSSNKKPNNKRWSLILGRNDRDLCNASIHSTHSTKSKAKPRRHSMFAVSRRRSGFFGKEECSTGTPSTRDADSVSDNEFQRLDKDQLERITLNAFRHWKSTADIDCRSTKKMVYRGKNGPKDKIEIKESLNLRLRSLLLDSPSISTMNTAKMEWRENMLLERIEKRKLLQALYTLKYNSGWSSMQQEEGQQAQQQRKPQINRGISRRLSVPLRASKSFKLKGNSSSTMMRRSSLPTELLSDDMSKVKEVYSPVVAATGDLSGIIDSSYGIAGLRSVGISDDDLDECRTFLDLTMSDDDDDTDNNGMLLKDSTPAVSLLKQGGRRRSTGMVRENRRNAKTLHESRRFIDLTKSEDDGIDDYDLWENSPAVLLKAQGRRHSIVPGFFKNENKACKDDSTTQVAIHHQESEHGREIELTTFSSNHRKENFDVAVESDDDDDYEYISWDKANAAFIQEVHSVSNQLEEKLMQHGHESPYSDIGLVFPSFKLLHYPIQESAMEPCRRRSATESFKESDSQDKEKSCTKSVESEGGVETNHHRSITKYAFYERHSSGFSLPVGLTKGLDKRLPSSTIDEAREIIENLTAVIPPQTTTDLLLTLGETVGSFRSLITSEY